MNEQNSGSLAPYSERNGMNAAEYVQAIFAAPETPLDDQEKAKAYEFAAGLFIGRAEGLVCDTAANLEDIRNHDARQSNQTFYLSYFSTQEGLADLSKLGITKKGSAGIADELANINSIKSKLDDESRKEISSKSLKWYKTKLEERLAAELSRDAEFADAEEVEVNYDPDKLLSKIDDLQAYRRFYRKVRGQIKNGPPSSLLSAKELLLNIHTSRVISQLADLHPLR